MMQRSRGSAWMVGSAASVLCAGFASASLVTFDDRASYMDALGASAGASVLETFESETVRVITSDDVMLESGLRIWSSNSNWTVDVTAEQGFSYNTTPGGSRHVRFAFGGTSDFWAVLQTPGLTNAFGFDLTGFQDYPGEGGFEVELRAGDVVVESHFIESPGTFVDRFHGIISEQSFDTVAVLIRGGDFVGFDDLTFVMIPAAGVLPAIAFGAMLNRRRRRL